MLGQPASWQTVWRPSVFTSCCRAVYSGPILARVLIHSGLRSIGVSELRTSRRRSLRPSGVVAGGVVGVVTRVESTRVVMVGLRSGAGADQADPRRLGARLVVGRGHVGLPREVRREVPLDDGDHLGHGDRAAEL